MEKILTNIKRFLIIIICVLLPFIGFGLGYSIATLGVSAYCDTDLFSTYIVRNKGNLAISQINDYKIEYIHNYALVFGIICFIIIVFTILLIFIQNMIKEYKMERLYNAIDELYEKNQDNDRE